MIAITGKLKSQTVARQEAAARSAMQRLSMRAMRDHALLTAEEQAAVDYLAFGVPMPLVKQP